MTDISYELVMMRGPSPGTIFALKDTSLIVGRDPLSNILINDPEVSRQHALLISEPSGDFRIQDLGSTNGTFVDGKRLGSKPVILRPSNNITMGGAVTLLFRESSKLEQAEPEQESDIAQIINDETPDSADWERESSGSAQEIVQNVSPKEIGVQGSQIPASQSSDEKDPAPPSLQEQQSAVPSSGDDMPIHGQIGTDASTQPSPNPILGLALLLLCSCASILVFLIYLRGDWFLRQIGLVP